MSTVEHDAAEEFGPYLVYERLGMGGMATVHRAKKRGIAGFERGVALKRLLPHLAEDKEFIQSFVREAKLASMLVHPNIAQIYDLGRVGAAYYIAMEHVEGIDVRKILRYARRSGEVIPLTVALQIIAELCDALEYAHTYVNELGEHMGIVHRDVSPSNLIISNSGHLKVIDFGIAKAKTKQHHTESGRIKGKLGYLAPEAAKGESWGAPSDVFSAGVVAFELLTTSPLFWGKNDYETLLKVNQLEVPPPSRINPAVPPDLDKLILQALERKGDDRLQSAGDLRVGLDRIATRYGFRLSSREVFDWLSGVSSESWATLKPAPRSLSQQQAAAAAAQLRPLPLPPPPEPQVSSRSTNSGRSTSIAHAAALAEAGHTLGAGSGLVPLPRTGEEDLIAELAWGSDGQSYPLLAGMSGTKPQLSRPSASLAVPKRGLARWALPVGVATALAALAGGALWLRSSTAEPGPKDPPVVSAAAAQAKLTFAVQPADAVVEVGLEGKRPDAANQVTLASGVYSVAIRREGFEPWIKEVTVRAGEDQAIQVALQPAKQANAPAPDAETAERANAAGDASASVGESEDSARRQAAASGRDRTARPNEARRSSAPDGADGGAVGTPALPHAAGAAGASSAGTGSASSAGTGSAGSEGSGSAGGTASSGASADGGNAMAQLPVDQGRASIPPAPAHSIPVAPPTPAAPAKQASTTTPVVSASKVTKVSGTMPNLRVSGRSRDLSNDVVAKLCIDEQGLVTSAQMVRSAAEISDEVQRSLRGWRYQPYLDDGVATPVCFAVPMRVVVVSSN